MRIKHTDKSFFSDKVIAILSAMPDTHTTGPRKGRSRGLRERIAGARLNIYFSEELRAPLTIADITHLTKEDLLNQRNVGDEAVCELQAALVRQGLSLSRSRPVSDVALLNKLARMRGLLSEAVNLVESVQAPSAAAAEAATRLRECFEKFDMSLKATRKAIKERAEAAGAE